MEPEAAPAAAQAGIALASRPAGGDNTLGRLAAYNPARYPFFLESSAGAAAQSRFDLLLAFPEEAFTDADFVHPSDFFTALDTCARVESTPAVAGLPFVGGWFVYLGYEMAAGVEPNLDLPRSDDVLPGALAVRCPAAIVHDRWSGQFWFLAENHDHARVAAMQADLEACGGQTPAVRPLVASWREEAPERYRAAVDRAREYIQAGDIFQANLARAWHGELATEVSPADVYAVLREANPAPFSGLVQWGKSALVCSSPERLLSIRAGQASMRPIAGTRRRSPGDDHAMIHELITHPKERAEHVMLIDLVRNDLGRVCRPKTLAVNELMAIESYAHVHHIVSDVEGRLCADTGPGSALKAVFPGGTITGCPKVRCMQIIAELEAVGRGAYTGSFGYLSRCGQLDTNIVIRSLTQHGRRLTLRTGAGIVADSEPGAELEETRHKARGVLRAFIDAQGRRHG